MCGIAGGMGPGLTGDAAALRARIGAMTEALAHRGPDGAGVWVDAAAGVALGHRRLAVVDLSPTGAQPMRSLDGRWTITYNGEIYNAGALAAELFGASCAARAALRGTSDTEVIVEAVARRGLEWTLTRLDGMFAMGLWDHATATLHLVRDRLGVKPLFYARQGTQLYFASELKGLVGVVATEVDPASVGSFLRYGYVPAPHTIYRGVSKVMPGEVVSVSPSGRVDGRRYWSLAQIARAGAADPLDLSDGEAIAALQTLLARTVADQMVADVPLGAFLSGGVDSSLVTALMVAAAGRNTVRTFSIGFNDAQFDESEYAARVANHLGTVHERLVVTAADALATIPAIPETYDEPFADSSQIPTMMLSRLTRKHVTVALTGDGGDELFAGYNRYRATGPLLSRLLGLPRPFRVAAARALNAIPPEAVAAIVPARRRPRHMADKLAKVAAILPHDAAGRYRALTSLIAEPGLFQKSAAEHALGWDWADAPGDALSRMQLIDATHYLPDDVLQKVDRASMAVALEIRPPLLGHHVAEFAFRLPGRFRIRGGQTKWLLRRVLEQHVPAALVERPKMGFAIPLADWLNGPLREWTEDLLDPRRFGGGLLDPSAAQALWARQRGGVPNAAYSLWPLLMYEAWRRRWAN